MVQGPRIFKSRDIKILRFWVLGFQGFATYPNFEVLVFQGLATIEILRSWVSRVPRQKGRARSKIHQGPRPWTQRTQDLGSFWDLGTSLVIPAAHCSGPVVQVVI